VGVLAARITAMFVDSSQDKPVVCFDISELFSTAHLFTRKCCQNFHLPRRLNIPTCCITFDYIILTEKWVTPSLTHLSKLNL
jgi:hypothetical protein